MICRKSNSRLLLCAFVALIFLPNQACTSITQSRRRVMDLLTGNFDNKMQAEASFAAGKDSASKGGHEYISVQIGRLAGREKDALVARYFYGTDPSQTFRFRIYEFPEDDSKEQSVRMKIYRPHKSTEIKLAKANFSFSECQHSILSDEESEYLPTCDLYWHPEKTDSGFRGKLANEGGVIIPSHRDPNRLLIIYDDLLVTECRLEINDRVFDKCSGALLIGNTEGIPYILDRLN
jgi:hypothetical protein